jgi:nitrite reductase/ring-hydroxylating ferredoxin subunit
MVVRTAEGGVLAYRNACPHMGVRLSPDPRRLLTREGDRLICFGHGALFRPEDGFCVSGPCAGAALTPVPVRVEAGRIVLS